METPEDLQNFAETFKDSDPEQYKILKGFIANVGRVRTEPKPSELDKRAVATAYYRKQIICMYIAGFLASMLQISILINKPVKNRRFFANNTKFWF